MTDKKRNVVWQIWIHYRISGKKWQWKDAFSFGISLQIRLEINKNQKSIFQFFPDIFESTRKIEIFKTAFGWALPCATLPQFKLSRISYSFRDPNGAGRIWITLYIGIFMWYSLTVSNKKSVKFFQFISVEYLFFRKTTK